MRQVVITGMEAITPAGLGADELWIAARDGRPAGGPIRAFDASAHDCRIAAEVPGFDPIACGLTPADVARMDRVTQFGVVAGRRAAAIAGVLDRVDPARAAVSIGTAIGGVGFMERTFASVCRNGHPEKPARVTVDPMRVDGHLYDAFLAQSLSTEISQAIGFEGPCLTITTGCTAGIDAIGTAYDLIAQDLADVAVTGGADAPVTPIVVASFDNIGCLTHRNDQPARASRPFDRDRDGFLLAEACAILVLEEEQHARRRGAEILGRILGYVSLSNAYHMTSLPADGRMLAATLSTLLDVSRIEASAVDYINAHGSSTQQNDRNETAAFKSVFGSRARQIPISGTKSVVGHSLGAASAVESVVCVRALCEGVVPPTANLDTPSPDCDLDYVPNEPRERTLRVVECNASGFSGIHSAMLFGHRDYRGGATP